MALLVTKVDPPTEPPDQYQNISYWVRIQGYETGVVVRHKHSTPMLVAGQDAEQVGWGAVQIQTSQKGKQYGKLIRADKVPPVGSDVPWTVDPPNNASGAVRTPQSASQGYDPASLTTGVPPIALRPMDTVSRSIAAQHAQKVAYEVVALAITKDGVSPLPEQITNQVRIVAASLFDQVVSLGEGQQVLPAADDVPFHNDGFPEYENRRAHSSRW